MLIIFPKNVIGLLCTCTSNALKTNFITEANTMNTDQTAPLRLSVLREQSDLGPYCLHYRPPKYIIKQF